MPPVKPSSIAIRFCQLLLLVVGIGWTWLISQNRLDETHIPGFLIALSVSWWLTPEIRARALRLGLVDKPGEERRIHKVPVPRLGGVAIYMSMMLTMTLLAAITGRFPHDARTPEGLLGVAVGGTLIFVLGLIDDLESLPAKIKLLVQILAACAAYSLGVRIKAIPIPLAMNIDLGFLQIHGGTGPIELGPWALPLTVVWLVGIANAVNLIDGMDGLAAGVSAISALTIWSVALAPNIDKPYAGLMAAVLAGALLGFLRWNFNPARIFLGDSGAYLTGFVLGAISITGVIKGAAAYTVIVPTFLLVLLILFFPILDTSWAIVRRVASRRSIFSPDAQHIHHRLLQAGLSQKNTAYLIYGVSAVLGFVATMFVNQQEYFLKLGASVLLMALFFAEVLNRHRQRRGGAPPADGSGEPQDPDSPPVPTSAPRTLATTASVGLQSTIEGQGKQEASESNVIKRSRKKATS
ncbi:MAG TPA: MraY family glycosyltransferase [Candidatus Obscuribacterales bacterium]